MEVEFYTSASGRNYVGDFIAVLPAKTIKKVYRQLELVEKYGLSMHSKVVKKLQGYDLYEIIIDFNRVCYRIFCVVRNTTCWLLHMFAKKTPNTPKKEINTALERTKSLDYSLSI